MTYSHDVKVVEEFTDITPIIQEDIERSVSNGEESGICLVYSRHTTACVGVLEYETLLKKDMHDFFERLAPSSCLYRHDDIEHRDVPPDERRNGFSHLRAMLLQHQQVIPIINGKLDLGKWQRVFFIECDPFRDDRQFCVKVIWD